MSKRIKDASEREETAGTGSLLSSLNLQTLKKIRVSIGPKHRSESSSSSDLERSLDDPSELLIHYRAGEGQKPIFSRDDIVVNPPEHFEKKIVLKDEHSNRSSKVYSERARSRDSYKSRSSHSYSRSPARKDPDRKVAHYKGRSKSPVKSSQKSEYLERIKKNEREERTYYPAQEKYYKDKSPLPGTSKYTSSKDRLSREREDYRKDKYRRPDYREVSPKRYEKQRSRSHSPRRLSSKYSEREKYPRTRSSPTPHSRKYSASPSKRRSRSPYPRKRSPSPRKRSHSPHDRGFRTSPPRSIKPKRRSVSPHERDHPSHSSYSRSVHYKRHSRSPYPSRKSRSPPPRRSEYSRTKRHSRSPYRKRHFDEHKGRSRSPSRSHKYSKLSDRRRSTSADRHEQKEMMPDFGYYGAEGFWIPAPFPRPGFLPRGVMPQMILPRGMMRPGQPPFVIHRPYMPMQPHPMQFRPRPPIRYNQPKHRTSGISTSCTASTSTTNTVARTNSTSTATVTTVAASTSSDNPIIEEPTSDSENVDSTVTTKN